MSDKPIPHPRQVDSLEECAATPGSVFVDQGSIYVHEPDPRPRQHGWDISFAIDAAMMISHPPALKIGDRLPMPERKLDIRPAFTGAGRPSFKPARSGKK
jgi:hypothetical protein